MEGNEYGADSFNRLENYESHASVAQGAELMPARTCGAPSVRLGLSLAQNKRITELPRG